MARTDIVHASLAIICLLVLPAVAGGHHSRAEFAGDFVELEGVITGMVWANPHPYVVVTSVGSEDGTKEWHIEMYGNLFSTERIGVTADRFVEGTVLRAAGPLSSRRDGYLLAYNLLFEAGDEAVLTSRASPRWSDQVLRNEGFTSEYEAERSAAAEENRGIFRVWTPETSGYNDLPFTEAAIAAREQWDELDNFLTRCEQPGMPWTMLTPQEIEFIDEVDSIRVHAQYFDTVRIIHMGATRESVENPATHLGYSIGRWEYTTLVVETTSIDWPFFDIFGTPLSPYAHVIERYTPSEDQSRLHIQISVTDPVVFTRPAVLEHDWLALGRTIEEYDCQVF
jgi:hypothetical protein